MKDLNLIPKSYLLIRKNKIKKAYLSFLILVIGFILAVAYITPTIYQMNLKRDMQLLQDQVNQSSSYVAIENKFNSLVQAVGIREQEGKNLSIIHSDFSAILSNIENAAPDKLFIETMTTSNENNNPTINLKGSADNEYTVASFVRNIIDDGYFKDIQIKSITIDSTSKEAVFDIAIIGLSKNNLQLYKNWNSKYSISYPVNWVVSKDTDSLAIITAPSTSYSSPASIEILANPTNDSLEVSFNKRVDTLSNKLKDFKKLTSNKTRICNADAYKFTYSSMDNNQMIEYSEICLIKNNTMFTVTYKDNYLDFTSKARTVDKILKSFKID